MNNNHICICTNFITNFKPKLLTDEKVNIIDKNPSQIKCKNFLFYLILLKNQNSIFDKNSIYIKKYKKKVYTILRSPYRHKLARHQINLNRYQIYNTIKIKINSIKIKNWFNLLFFINKIKKINKIFESNVVYINNIKVSFNFKIYQNFKIKNF